MYSINTINSIGGHVMTNDQKYYLASDGNFDYWHKVKSLEGETLKLDYQLGRTSYDYCFRCSLQGCVENLNELIRK